MTSYTYPANSGAPPNQAAPYSNYSNAYSNQTASADNPQWNQSNSYGQQSGQFSNYDQQSSYSSNQQYNQGGSDSGYGGYKRNDNYGKGGSSNFRGNQNPGSNRSSGQGYNNKGPRSNFGGPSGMEEQQDTIFVSGLSEDTTEDELKDFFGSIGLIKMDKKTRKPKIWVYKNKETGKPKGEVTITYDDPPTAGSAIAWFNGKELNGAVLKVELAQRKNSYLASGSTGAAGGGGNRSNSSSFGNRNNRDFDNKGGNDRGNDRGKSSGGPSREGDWICPNESCKNNNFAYRTSCNRCKTERPGGSGGGGSDRRNSDLPYERRGPNSGGGNRSFGGPRNGGNQDRGSFRGNGGRDQRGGKNGSFGPMKNSSNNRRAGPY